jgi:phage terminase large subunit GpA-like protein
VPRGFTPEQRRSRFGTGGTPVILPTQTLYEHLRMADEQEREKRTPFLEWALRIPEPKTGRLDFRRWKFQRDMYGDEVVNAKEVVVQKSTQVGISVWLIRSGLYWPDMKGLTAVYIFPKKVQLGEFVQQRIRPLVRTGEYLPSRVPRDHIDNTFQKQIGLGFINFRGSDVIDDLDSIDADWIGFDEYDRLNQKNIEHAEHRVDASPLGLIRRIGNPTVDDYGVSASYEASDKRQWFVRCECGERQPLVFEHLDQDEERLVCRIPDCRRPLDVLNGEWVAEHPDRDVIGFHVSRLMDPTPSRSTRTRTWGWPSPAARTA